MDLKYIIDSCDTEGALSPTYISICSQEPQLDWNQFPKFLRNSGFYLTIRNLLLSRLSSFVAYGLPFQVWEIGVCIRPHK